MRRHKKRRGQVVVFYALMIPLFLFAGGVGLDLGWYYLNVSRLQHAADASVIVGARVLAMDTTNFKDYVYKSLVDKYPGDKPDPDNRDTTAGDHAAAMYALKNLSSDRYYLCSERQVLHDGGQLHQRRPDNHLEAFFVQGH